MTDVPKIVAQRLQADSRVETHPDPNLLSAFLENSLPQRERAQVLEHLAGCADCRDVTALAIPEHVSDVTVVVPARSPWLPWPALRWGALAACVVVVGAAVTLRYRSHETSTFAPTLQAQQGVQQSKQAQPEAATTAREVVTSNAASSPPGRDRTVAAASGKATPGSLGGPAAANQPVTPEKQTAPAELKSPDQTAASASEAVKPKTGTEVAELVPGRAKDAEPVPQSLRSGQAVREGTLAKRTMAAPMSAVSNASPRLSLGLAPRWTLTSDGTLQRSLDSGRTWETITVSPQARFRALAADGMDIWVGGAKGVLYHSIDAGQHWAQVQPVAGGQLLTADIIGVEFTDRLHGTLTTSDKESWATHDAGQTWQKK